MKAVDYLKLCEAMKEEMEMIWETASFNGQGCRQVFPKLFFFH
jgi:hypothetical protein